LHPIFRNFRAQTLWRYPLDDHADYKYNKELPSVRVLLLLSRWI